MTERTCIRSCTRRGHHYAACVDYGRTDGDCSGCVIADARDGSLVCHRCYSTLRRILEQAPELVEGMRSRLIATRTNRYNHVPSAGPQTASEPLSVDLLDALRDVQQTISAPRVPHDASPARWREAAAAGVTGILDHYDDLANDANAFIQWWMITVPHTIQEAPDFWTLGRALAQWPTTDRRRRARALCPDCRRPKVTISPPTGPRAPIWYECTACHWQRDEHDSDGRWVAIFGDYDPTAEAIPAEEPTTIPEWGDPLINRTEAAQIAGSGRTLQRWIARGLLKRETTTATAGSTVALFRRSEVERVRQDMAKRIGRPPKNRPGNTEGNP